ncbi:MAG: CoA-binding protein [Candidatus Thorarchaeota archaeon]
MMQQNKPTIAEMLDIKSVAIIGVSAKLGYYWAHSMLQWESDLNVWLVSHRGGEVLGHKIHQSFDEIPEKIDYAIIAVPYKYVPQTLDQLNEKEVKGVTIFTSGFSELGTEEGIERELELKKILDKYGIRAFGPNCMGLMYPEIGFAFNPTAKRLVGDVSFLSQSGGVAIATYTAGVAAGVGFSKVFSFGNQIDIKPQELLNYLRDDKKTKVVGAYIEGAKNGRQVLDALVKTAEQKPVVVLKGGRSTEGSRAAASHTGALAGKNEIWNAVFRQANVQTVDTLEDLVATLSIFSLSPKPQSRNVGLVAISGGTSVIYTDLCVESGLNVPKTSQETIDKLDPLIRDVGTGLGNPIDLAADYYVDETTSEVIRLVGEEPNFDSLIIEADIHNMFQVATILGAQDNLVDYWEIMAKAGKHVVEKLKKPVLVAIPDVAYPGSRSDAWNVFVEHGLPVFHNVKQAINALSKVCSYYDVKDSRK